MQNATLIIKKRIAELEQEKAFLAEIFDNHRVRDEMDLLSIASDICSRIQELELILACISNQEDPDESNIERSSGWIHEAPEDFFDGY